MRDIGRWRIPLILRLGPDVGEDDVRTVLTAVANHHDVLRLRIVERAGILEQHFDEAREFGELAIRSISDDVAPGSPREREELSAIVDEQVKDHQLLGAPLTATYVRGRAGSPGYLVLSLHAVASDDASRDILLTDIFTGFEQRVADRDVELQPATTSWREWSQRCASLATHPAVLESRDYWLETASRATLSVVGPDTIEPPSAADLERSSSSLTVAETAEIDEAMRRLRVPVDDLLLAALSRTVAATVGDGSVAVDVGGPGRSVLKPDVDTRRSVGWFTTLYPVVLRCSTTETSSARELLGDVRKTLKSVPHYGIGYGLLRYNYAPTARLLAAARRPDIFFTYAGTIPDLGAEQPNDRPVEFYSDMAMPVRDAPPGLGHALEVRAYRSRGALHLDWWYDARRVGSADAESLAGEFVNALLSVGREALAEDDVDSDSGGMALVDLS
jgi:phthiocerol/phenolphthiocerol synthesis type-I polyketide synthase E